MANTTRPKLPPGPSYIVNHILSWKTAACTSSIAVVRAAADAAGVHVPVWTIIASSVVALPAVLFIQSELRYWRDRRTAESLGARLAPKVAGRKPFGIDLIAAFLETHKSGYIGEPSIFHCPLPRDIPRLDLGNEVSGWTTEFGQTINLYYLGTSHVGLIYFGCHHRSR